MHTFERQRSSQSLADGLAEYHRSNPALARDRDLSAAAQSFFHHHDLVHVVYGCGLSLNDELIVKLSSVFGTTGGFGVLRGYRLIESVQIYRTLGARDILSTLLQSMILVPRTILRCLRQHKRWPWDDAERFMQTSLRELRREYGIVVAHDDGRP